MQRMLVSPTLNVVGESLAGDLEGRASVAVRWVSTAVVEEESGQAAMDHLRETGGTIRLERVFSSLGINCGTGEAGRISAREPNSFFHLGS